MNVEVQSNIIDEEEQKDTIEVEDLEVVENPEELEDPKSSIDIEEQEIIDGMEEQSEQDAEAVFDEANDSEAEGLPFDLYVPFAVLLGDKQWDHLCPVSATTEQEEESVETLLPASRIKRVMKMDPDVNIVSKQALNIVTKATTLFVDMLASKTKEWLDKDGGKQVKNATLIQVCRQTPSLRFLLDDLSLEEMTPKRTKTTRTESVEPKKPKVTEDPANSIKHFFRKSFTVY